MKLALVALALIGIVFAVAYRQAQHTGKEADDRVRKVADLLEQAIADAPPPRPAPPSGPWIVKVNAECSRRETQLEALPGPGGLDQVATHARDVLAIHRSYAKRVAALNAPWKYGTEKRTIDRLNARQVQVLARVARAASTGDVSGASRQARALRVLAGDANVQFLRLGLPACPFRPSGMPL